MTAASPSRLVVALGGNALQKGHEVRPQDQWAACLATARSLLPFAQKGHKIAIVHGNGPQVGEVVLTSELAHKVDPRHPILPFDVCASFTQGYIGYHLQKALHEVMGEVMRSGARDVASLITQVEVDADDPAFANPSKPIGTFYSQEEAQKLAQEEGYTIKEDAGRGYRRVIASPKPRKILESGVIKGLFEASVVTICCGGGGIPVVRRGGRLEGVPAVIDKDLAAAKLAEVLEADTLLILTAVDQVAIDFNKPTQRGLSKLSVEEAKRYISEGQFAPGSMLPKIEASLSFLERNPRGTVLIAALEQAASALEGRAGTRIVHA